MSIGRIIRRVPSTNSTLHQHPVDRLFDELRHGFDRPSTSFVAERVGRFQPTVDVAESDDEYRVTAELPGVGDDGFEVLLEDGVLTIKGEKKPREQAEGFRLRRSEGVTGAFARKLRFPQELDADKVTARTEHGVLEVVLPKAEEAKPRTRTIEVTSA